MIRHGEIPSNVKKIYAGRSSETLTPRGICQAEAVAEELKSYNILSIYTSPMQRALQTAHIIGDEIGKKAVVNDAFREMELGPWEGLSENDIAHTYPEDWHIWHERPAELTLSGRETLHELLERVVEGVKNIYNHAEKQDVVIVTHVAVIRVLLLWNARKSLNLYKTIHIQNAEIFKIIIESCPSL